MCQNLCPLDSWPVAEILRKNLPNLYKKHFSNVKCIINCFEIFTKRHIAFKARASTKYYFNHKTLKVPIAVAPNGAITLIVGMDRAGL